MSEASSRVKRHLKLFCELTMERMEKRRRKEHFLGRSSPWPLSLHIFVCFWENGSLPFDNKNHRERKKKTQFSSGNALFYSDLYMNSFTQKNNTIVHFGRTFIWTKLHPVCLLLAFPLGCFYINVLVLFFHPEEAEVPWQNTRSVTD